MSEPAATARLAPDAGPTTPDGADSVLERRGHLVSALWVVCLLVLLGANAITSDLAHPVAVALVWAGCLALLARASPRGLLSMECLYLGLLGLFHLGMVVPDALGVQREPDSDWLDSPHLALSLRLVVTAAIAFTLGARLGARAESGEERLLPPRSSLYWTGLLVALAGAALLWIGILALGVLGTSYGDYYERALSEDVRFFGFGMMLFPMGLLVAAVGATPRGMVVLSLLLACVTGPLFVGGFRGPLIVQAAALMTVWVRKDPRLARRLAAAAGIGLLVLAPAIRMTRGKEATLSEAIGKARPLDFILEAGGSLYPLVATCELMNGEPFWMGRSYLMAVERIVPNVSLSPSSPRQVQELAPSAWVTKHMSPWQFEHGGGLGFSGVAEPYLNFGPLGVLVFFLLAGYAARVCDGWLSRGHFRAAVVAASFGFVLWTVRNDMMVVFRAVAYAAVIVMAAWVVDRFARRQGGA